MWTYAQLSNLYNKQWRLDKPVTILKRVMKPVLIHFDQYFFFSENNKTGKNKTTAFLTMKEAKIFLLFCNCFSFTNPVLCFNLSDFLLKGNSKATKFIAFTCVFSG